MKKILFEFVKPLLLCLTLFTGFCAQSQTAYEKLFWMGYNPGNLESIKVDGTGYAMPYSSGHSSFALEIDVPNQKVYWYDLDDDAIMRSNLDGTNATAFVSGVIDAQGMSIDFANQKLFWCSTSSLSIESINLDGTGRTTVVATASAGQPETIKVDVTNQKIYWFDHNTYSMMRANTNGTNVETFIAYTGGNVFQIDIDEANSKLYFPVMGPATIESINLDGTGRTTLVSGFVNVGWPQALTVDKVNGKIYWWDGDSYVIKRANLNGTGVQTFLTDIYSVAAMMAPFERTITLPLTLLSFAGKENANGIYLQWTTANEVNTAAFDIERSSNGNNFIKIGSVVAGVSNTYSYTDTDPVAGTSSTYRLKMRDIDGKFTYSPVVLIKQTANKAVTGYSAYPNPVTGSFLYIKPITGNTADIQVAVVDLGGRTLLTRKLTAGNITNGRFELPVKQLPHGSYILRISDKNGEHLQVTKFNVGD